MYTRSNLAARRKALLCGTAVVFVLGPLPALATDFTWTGATATYESAANWGGAGFPQTAADTGSFGATGNTTPTVSTAVSPGSLTFLNTAQSYTLGGTGTVTFTGGGLIDHAAATQTINVLIAGSAPITVDGGGTLSLSQANAGYTGAATITSGALLLSNTSALGTGSITLNGGQLTLGASIANAIAVNTAGGTISANANGRVLSGVIANGNGTTGALTFSGGTQPYLTAVNTYTGATIIANDGTKLFLSGAGSIAASSGLSTAGINASFDISQITATGTAIQSLSGNGFIYLGGKTLTITNGSGTYSGALLDGGNGGGSGGSLAITGGTETLTAGGNANVNDSFTGGVTITGGTLVASNAGALGSGTATLNGGTLSAGGSAVTLTNAIAINSTGGSVNGGAGGLTLNGVIANGSGTPAGTLTVSGGTVTLTAANTYTGTTGIAAGATLALSGTATLASANIADAGTLDVSNVNSSAFVQSLSGAGTVNIGGKSFQLQAASGTFSGTFTGAGGFSIFSGKEILTGDNSGFTGTTIISPGATLQVGAGGTSGVLGSGAITDNGTLVYNRSDTVTLPSLMASGTGGLTQAGTGTLVITNNYQFGPVVISAGTLQIGNGGTAGLISATSITDNGTLAFAHSDNIMLTGPVSGTGGLSQTGSGILSLTGVSTYTGATSIASGSTLALSGAGSIAASSGVTNNGGTFDISGTTSGASIQSLSGSGSVTLGAKTLTLTNAGGTYSGSISGTGSIAITGSETLTGTSSYSGGTLIASGATLQVGNGGPSFNNSIGSGPVTDNGTLSAVAALGQGAGFANNISGTGGVTLSAPNGTLGLTGVDTYSGPTTLNGGTLSLGINLPNSAIIDQVGSAVTVTANTGATIVSLSGGGGLNLGTTGLTLSNASGTFSGLFSGTGTLTIAAGTEIITTNPACGCSANVTIASGATLQSNGVPLTIIDNGAYILALPANTSFLYSSAISGSGSVTLNAPGSTLSLLTAETYTGLTTITAGTLALAGSGGIAASSGVADNGVFDISGTTSGASIKTLSGAGSVVLGSKTLTITGASGSFGGVISGTGGIATAGSETLTAAQTYTGATGITSGTLALSGAGSIAASSGVADAGTFDISATTAGASVKSISGAGGVALGARTLTITAAAGTLSGAISGTGGVTVSGGTQILSGANSYTGSTTISSGTLQIGAGGAAGAVAGNIADNGALVFNRSDTLTYGGVISGSGTLTQAGSGTLILNGVNTYTGATLVSAGTLEIGDGNNPGASLASPVTVASGATLAGHGSVTGGVTVQSGGTLKPGGSVGTLTVAGNLVLPAGTTLSDEVSPTAGSKVAVSGTATLGGALAIVADPGTYAPGTDYKVLTAANVIGTFSSVSGSVPGQTGTIQYSTSGVDYIIGTTPPPPSTGGTAPPAPVTTTFLFNSYARTPNGVAAGAALTAGAYNGALYLATGNLVSASPAAVPGALAQMAGDIHASIRGAAVEDSRLIRDAVINHLVRGSDSRIVWGTLFGGYGSISTTGNASGLHHDSQGFVVGADTMVMEDLRLGVAGGFAANRDRTADRSASAHAEMGHIIAYANWSRNALDLKLGGDAGIGNAHVYRTITALSASEADRQSQRVAQIFGEAGYKLETDAAMAEPYVRIADIAATTGSFAETGGVAALSGGSKTDNQAYAVLGIRGLLGSFDLGGISVTPRDDFGWQHALNRFLPSQALAFQSSATSFTVQGVPLGTDAGTAQLGVDVALAPGAVLTVGYDGSFSNRVQNNAANVALNWTF